MVYVPEYQGGRFEDSKEREDGIIFIILNSNEIENVETTGQETPRELAQLMVIF
jgi:hypothetical protein